MTVVASWDVQKAIVKCLRETSGIVSALSGVSDQYSIYDAVPVGAAFPYIVVGEGAEEDASAFGETDSAVMANVEVWTADGELTSSSGAEGYKQGMAIAELVATALYADNALTISGRTVTVLRRESVERKRFLPENGQPACRVVIPTFLILVEG